ncbi:MAG: hypothetical protein H0T42_30575 [Deltaproteobacteria bacterium]|nr:hypothetical protein [Deltaproteobacteria bacterium]
MMRALIVMVLIAGCGGEHRAARDIYNQGVAAIVKGDYEAAEKLLLDARSQAGVDPELRFHAAYDLGVAYAAHADKVKLGEKPDLAKALELAQQALSWFNDAARLRKDDPNTLANLAIVRARVQAISDELRKGEGSLEARLDRLIADQRTLLDDARGAWLSIKQAGGTDPLAHQGTLTHLADRERGIVAEAGVIVDLASDEIDAIGKKPEEKRTDEERVRVVQLKNLDLYLLDGRTRIAEARRKLQELAAEEGVVKAEAALTALKRAREQLLDPITVLRGVAQDELVVLQETTYAAAAAGTLELGPDQQPPSELPAWLASPLIAERQGGLRDRLEEVRARLAAATEHSANPAPATPPDPKQAKLLERVKVAVPFVVEASTAMDRARETLAGNQLKSAIDHERAALVALSAAIEQFADLKQTVELAYGDHHQLVTMLGPEAAKQMKADLRAKETREALARNVARMPRLKELIAEEVAGLQDPPADTPADKLEAAKQAIEQQRQMLARAEELRGQAQTALDQLAKAFTANTDPLPPATDADAKLTELRKLLFSVIEHLQQLIRDQGETRDQTSAAHAEDPLSREPKIPGLVGRQSGHGEIAKAITEALAAQADAASKAPAQPQQGGPDPKTLSAAAAEVRLAQSEMGDAGRILTKARDSKTSSETLEPSVKSQAKAIEHLEAALRLLQPPQDQKQDPQDKKQDQQEQKQDKQEEQKPGGASQRARDDDARRQKERRKQESQGDPAEKDW